MAKGGLHSQKNLYPTESGTPQGGVISATLANMTLDGLEAELKKFSVQDKVHMVRYADDFIITGTPRVAGRRIKP